MNKFLTCLIIVAFFFLPAISAVAQDTDTVSVVVDNENYAFIQSITPSSYIVTAINLLLGGAGVASFIFLLIGGFNWITAGSDKDAMEKARKKIINSFVGLAIVFSSYVFMYILRALFQVDIIGFDLNPLGT